MREGVQSFAAVGVPDFAKRFIVIRSKSQQDLLTAGNTENGTHAVKSALPVAAREVSSEILDDHTAPLWPVSREFQVGRQPLKLCDQEDDWPRPPT
jgi:hypothetical protein